MMMGWSIGDDPGRNAMIEDYRASERPAWHLIAQELLGVAAAAALYPFGIKRSRQRVVADYLVSPGETRSDLERTPKRAA